MWDEVLARLGEHEYMGAIARDKQRIDETAEVFTPAELVVEMLREVPLERLGPGKTVLDPACGDGQFLVAAKWVKILGHEMTEEAALGDLYGVDIMRDNVDLCRARLGGGTIVMGDTLNPEVRLPGQSDDEHRMMLNLFVPSQQMSLLA